MFDDTCRIEIDQLQQQVVAEREKYHEQTSQETVGSRAHAPCTTQQGDGLSAVSLFPINDRFALIEGEAAYMLTLELLVAIDYVLIQSTVAIDLLDVAKNSAVVSFTKCEPSVSVACIQRAMYTARLQSGNSVLATYRCQANTTRLDIKLRSIEGQYGTLSAYVSPKTHPKICQVRAQHSLCSVPNNHTETYMNHHT